jgi:hypothetical protein
VAVGRGKALQVGDRLNVPNGDVPHRSTLPVTVRCTRTVPNRR